MRASTTTLLATLSGMATLAHGQLVEKPQSLKDVDASSTSYAYTKTVINGPGPVIHPHKTVTVTVTAEVTSEDTSVSATPITMLDSSSSKTPTSHPSATTTGLWYRECVKGCLGKWNLPECSRCNAFRNLPHGCLPGHPPLNSLTHSLEARSEAPCATAVVPVPNVNGTVAPAPGSTGLPGPAPSSGPGSGNGTAPSAPIGAAGQDSASLAGLSAAVLAGLLLV